MVLGLCCELCATSTVWVTNIMTITKSLLSVPQLIHLLHHGCDLCELHHPPVSHVLLLLQCVCHYEKVQSQQLLRYHQHGLVRSDGCDKGKPPL